MHARSPRLRPFNQEEADMRIWVNAGLVKPRSDIVVAVRTNSSILRDTYGIWDGKERLWTILDPVHGGWASPALGLRVVRWRKAQMSSQRKEDLASFPLRGTSRTNQQSNKPCNVVQGYTLPPLHRCVCLPEEEDRSRHRKVQPPLARPEVECYPYDP